jgi:hypothetical protein
MRQKLEAIGLNRIWPDCVIRLLCTFNNGNNNMRSRLLELLRFNYLNVSSAAADIN